MQFKAYGGIGRVNLIDEQEAELELRGLIGFTPEQKELGDKIRIKVGETLFIGLKDPEIFLIRIKCLAIKKVTDNKQLKKHIRVILQKLKQMDMIEDKRLMELVSIIGAEMTNNEEEEMAGVEELSESGRFWQILASHLTDKRLLECEDRRVDLDEDEWQKWLRTNLNQKISLKFEANKLIVAKEENSQPMLFEIKTKSLTHIDLVEALNSYFLKNNINAKIQKLYFNKMDEYGLYWLELNFS